MDTYFPIKATGFGVLALVIFATFPIYLSGYLLSIFIFALYLAVYAMSWDLMFGYANEVNFGPSFLIGVGGYAAGLCNSLAGLPVWPSIFVGAAAATLAGVLLVAPALRTSGPYFGLITFIAVLLLYRVVVVLSKYTGGEIGLTVPGILSASDTVNYYAVLVLAAGSAIVLYIISRSPLGLVLQSYGQDPVATAAMGYNITALKVFTFAVSAFFSGLAGAMTVFFMGSASPSTLIIVGVSVQVIIATVIGGRRTIFGSILGALFLLAANQALQPLGQLDSAIVAVVGVTILVISPNGIVGLMNRMREGKW